MTSRAGDGLAGSTTRTRVRRRYPSPPSLPLPPPLPYNLETLILLRAITTILVTCLVRMTSRAGDGLTGSTTTRISGRGRRKRRTTAYWVCFRMAAPMRTITAGGKWKFEQQICSVVGRWWWWVGGCVWTEGGGVRGERAGCVWWWW